uniref:TAF5-like RNA polymerase II p300/CBP-associated factor-associated factor 65 kDa subunit 5L isoform X2 n=1 Tax=Myxine glutinosa TaxID=7769 RepID=UPI00358E9418
MKRVRAEQLQSAVNQLLKRRQYPEPEQVLRQASRGVHTAGEMAANLMVLSESGPLNAVSFGMYQPDPAQYDAQFSSLQQFISDQEPPLLEELQSLLHPLFLCFYLELLSGGWRSAAEAFLARHGSTAGPSAEQRLVVEQIAAALARQDAGSDPSLHALSEGKLCVCLSAPARARLLNHLCTSDSTLVLRAMATHIQLEAKPALGSGPTSLQLQGDTDDCGVDGTSQAEVEEEALSLPPDELSLNMLQESIRCVKDSALPSASIHLYAFNADSQMANPPCFAEVSPDLSMLASGYDDSQVVLWTLRPRKLHGARHHVDVSHINLACDLLDDRVIEDSEGSDVKILRAHAGPVYATHFLPEHTGLLSCSEDTTVRYWNLHTFSNVACYRGHARPVWSLDVAPLGLYFASGSADRTARLWSPERTFPLRIYAGHLSDVNTLRFHPNGAYLATGSADRSVRLWVAQQGSAARLFTGHRGPVLALAFAPGGRLLASAGEDLRIRIWDIGSGGVVKELRGHTDNVTTLSFSPDGSSLASGSADGSVRVWDVRGVGSGVATNVGGGDSEAHEFVGISPNARLTTVLNVQFVTCNLLLVSGSTREESGPSS